MARLRLAGWWRRAGATLIDGIVLLAVVAALVAGLAAGVLPEDSGWFVTYALGAVIAAACLVLAVVLYAPLLMARTNGRTLGRMATDVRVARTDGAPMGVKRALLRDVVLKWGLGALTLGLWTLVDVLWPLWDEQNRALHDLLARTRVIRD